MTLTLNPTNDILLLLSRSQWAVVLLDASIDSCGFPLTRKNYSSHTSSEDIPNYSPYNLPGECTIFLTRNLYRGIFRTSKNIRLKELKRILLKENPRILFSGVGMIATRKLGENKLLLTFLTIRAKCRIEWLLRRHGNRTDELSQSSPRITRVRLTNSLQKLRKTVSPV